jgi:hypothetical protein
MGNGELMVVRYPKGVADVALGVAVLLVGVSPGGASCLPPTGRHVSGGDAIGIGAIAHGETTSADRLTKGP